jgi:hypothetical protein
MPPAGFEATISADEWPQTYALDRAATGTGNVTLLFPNLKLPVQYYLVVLLETPCHTRRVSRSTLVFLVG